MLLSKKPRIYDVDVAGVLVIVLVAGLGWLGLIKPLDGRIMHYQTQQAKARSEQDQAEQQLRQAQRKAQQQRLLVQRVQHIRELLRQNEGLDKVIGHMSHLADDHGISLSEIRAQLPETRVHGRRSQLDIELLGSFDHCMQYLYSLTDNMPYLRMSTMKVRTPSPGQGSCEISLALQVYAL